jgi:hypothetical protein
MTEHKLFVSTVDGWVAGRRVKAGQSLMLTDAAAQYEPVTPAGIDMSTSPDVTVVAEIAAPRKRKAKA